MDAQQKETFINWLLNGGGGCTASAKSIGTYARDVKRVQDRIGINLDTQGIDGLKRLYDSLAYTTGNLHPNQVSMGWTANTPRGTPDGYRASINHYHKFLNPDSLPLFELDAV